MTFPSDMVDMEMVHMDMVDMDMVDIDMVDIDRAATGVLLNIDHTLTEWPNIDQF